LIFTANNSKLNLLSTAMLKLKDLVGIGTDSTALGIKSVFIEGLVAARSITGSVFTVTRKDVFGMELYIDCDY